MWDPGGGEAWDRAGELLGGCGMGGWVEVKHGAAKHAVKDTLILKMGPSAELRWSLPSSPLTKSSGSTSGKHAMHLAHFSRLWQLSSHFAQISELVLLSSPSRAQSALPNPVIRRMRRTNASPIDSVMKNAFHADAAHGGLHAKSACRLASITRLMEALCVDEGPMLPSSSHASYSQSAWKSDWCKQHQQDCLDPLGA